MGAALDDHALVEHENLIGVNDSRKAVGDDQRGAVFRHPIERVLDILLGVAVEGGGRLVEEQDRWGLEDGAGNGDALLLAAGKFQAALTDFGLVAFGRVPDKAVDLG